LALTSTAGWIRRLGGNRWRALHRLIYVSAIAGVIHYWWLVKADISKPAKYAFVLSLLLGYRVVAWLVQKRKAASVLARRAEVAQEEKGSLQIRRTGGTPVPAHKVTPPLQ